MVAEPGPCVPYLEASGALAIPPAGWITFEPGTVLTVTSLPHPGGMFEVAPATDARYRGLGGGRVYFARDVQIATGIRARRGAAAVLGGIDGSRLGVYATNNRMYLVPCDAISTAAVESASASSPPVTRDKLRVLREDAHLIVEGEESTIWRLGPGQQVEVLGIDGHRAEVRFERDGFVYTGLVAQWHDGQLVLRGDLLAMPDERDDPEMLIGQNPGGEPIVLLGKSDSTRMADFGVTCAGKAVLRARSPLFSGPIRSRAPADNETPVREIPPLDLDAHVTLRAVLDDYRAVEITNPTPEVASIVAWVRAGDLDRPTCEAP